MSRLGEPAVEGRQLRVTLGTTSVLNGCDVALAAGEVLAIMGPSGSGKSTLLHCLAGLIAPDTGEVWFAGSRLDDQPDRVRSRIRLSQMGLVFQFGDLVPELTLRENVELPLQLSGSASRRVVRSRTRDLLREFDISDVADRYLNEVSGGQAQRAAVARALVCEPSVVFTDEPTGSLDTLSGELVMDALVRAVQERGTSVLLVTHEHRVAAYAARTVTMVDGQISSRTRVSA